MLRHCSPQVPPGRSKWLFGPALVLPVHSKRLLGLLESDSVPPGRSKCLKKAQKCSKRRKEAQKGARKGCSSLLRRRLCAQRGFSSVLFEIAVRKSWSRLHCALSHCTLHCFAPCMDMHGCKNSIYTSVDPCISMHGPKQCRVQWLRARCNREQLLRTAISNSTLEKPL